VAKKQTEAKDKDLVIQLDKPSGDGALINDCAIVEV
jgi:hypothetical protein